MAKTKTTAKKQRGEEEGDKKKGEGDKNSKDGKEATIEPQPSTSKKAKKASKKSVEVTPERPSRRDSPKRPTPEVTKKRSTSSAHKDEPSKKGKTGHNSIKHLQRPRTSSLEAFVSSDGESSTDDADDVDAETVAVVEGATATIVEQSDKVEALVPSGKGRKS